MSGSVSTYRSGMIAELVAAAYLLFKGYRLIGWRQKTPVGEIDLIVRKGDTIVFVEVKSRQDNDGAVYAVHKRNQYRVTRAAQYLTARRPDWLEKNKRFDIVAISWPFFIRHIDNAWLGGA